MKATDAYKQLNSRTEYLSPVDKIQTVLSEGKGASTYFEGVIAACHNYSHLKPKLFKEKILTDKTVTQFLSAADSGG